MAEIDATEFLSIDQTLIEDEFRQTIVNPSVFPWLLCGFVAMGTLSVAVAAIVSAPQTHNRENVNYLSDAEMEIVVKHSLLFMSLKWLLVTSIEKFEDSAIWMAWLLVVSVIRCINAVLRHRAWEVIKHTNNDSMAHNLRVFLMGMMGVSLIVAPFSAYYMLNTSHSSTLWNSYRWFYDVIIDFTLNLQVLMSLTLASFPDLVIDSKRTNLINRLFVHGLNACLSLVYHIHVLYITKLESMSLNVLLLIKLRMDWMTLSRCVIAYKTHQRRMLDLEGVLRPVCPEDTEDKTCVICREDIGGGSEVEIGKLQCGHVFHKDCVIPWIQQQQKCPTCFSDIKAQEIVTEQSTGLWSWMISLLPGQATLTQDELDNMVAELRQVFPDVDPAIIAADLQITRSLTVTSNNIMEGAFAFS
eukprot:m.16840 g.16840  ORF g.16840 m.16840 type:complete len:414 (-) comp5820_c0_seq1:51-1292(-)